MPELKNLKKGDTVILHMFTGIAVGVKEVLAADAKTVTLETRKGNAKFSKATGVQVEPKAKQDKFANYITEDDGSFVPRAKKEKAKKTKKSSERATASEDGEDKETIPTKKTKKSKKTAEPPAKEPEEEEEFNEDDYEEVE